MENRFNELMEQSSELPHGDVKIEILEEAIRIADTLQDEERGFYARMELTDTANFAGRFEKVIPSFSWCLAQLDKAPEYYHEFYLLWQYKWVLYNLSEFPQIQQDQIEDTFNDFKNRCQQYGYSLRPYYQMKIKYAKLHENHNLAHSCFEAWLEQPRDDLSDCYACELTAQAEHLLHIGQVHAALAIAEPIFKQEVSCAEVPHITYSPFLIPLLENDSPELANEFHQSGMRLIGQKQGFLSTIAHHMKYLTVVDPNAAIHYMEAFLSEALISHTLDTKFQFFLACSILLKHLDPETIATMQLPDHITSAWIDEEVKRLAQQFDQRNQTHTYAKEIAHTTYQINALRQKYGNATTPHLS
ncbi:hypothetical protein IC620_14870 [Hazenella sp. IB182357]|uniref:Uncharacterized protein n=1 Tax=Polycladospora coralii TaxID=2771432 RepID=A0A926NBP4_9BACL|nr:hypothetical protein [Polycladospora coralii]MBD1373627.1 hypothetical protein [Polycladospora coralii]